MVTQVEKTRVIHALKDGVGAGRATMGFPFQETGGNPEAIVESAFKEILCLTQTCSALVGLHRTR